MNRIPVYTLGGPAKDVFLWLSELLRSSYTTHHMLTDRQGHQLILTEVTGFPSHMSPTSSILFFGFENLLVVVAKRGYGLLVQTQALISTPVQRGLTQITT